MVILLNLGSLIITELEGSPVSLNEKYCIQQRKYRRQILGMSVSQMCLFMQGGFPLLLVTSANLLCLAQRQNCQLL